MGLLFRAEYGKIQTHFSIPEFTLCLIVYIYMPENECLEIDNLDNKFVLSPTKNRKHGSVASKKIYSDINFLLIVCFP